MNDTTSGALVVAKLAHCLVGAVILFSFSTFGIVPAFCAVMFAATAKELYDHTGRGTPELLDAVATLAGGAALLGWYVAVGVV